MDKVVKWCNINKSEHIEIFSKETVCHAREAFGDAEAEDENFVSFDYSNRNPVTHSANIHILKKNPLL